jgi:hypothetical protein
VLVEPDDQPDLVRARGDGVAGGEQGRAAGGAAVDHVGEREAGQAETADHGVRPARGVGAAHRELDVRPAHPGVSERRPGRGHGHLQPGYVLVTAERVDADARDGQAAGHDGALLSPGAPGRLPPLPAGPGANAYAATVVPSLRGNGSMTSCMGMPMRYPSGVAAPVSRPWTAIPPSSAT